MIHLILPPRSRPSSCPFVQRTSSVVAILEQLEEPFRTYASGERFRTIDGDLVFYSYPEGPQQLIRGTIPVECGVGYDSPPWGAWRVYETQAWRHFMFGKYAQSLEARRNSWVIPWAFDPEAWPPAMPEQPRSYVTFLSRLASDKGINALLAVADACPDLLFSIGSTESPPAGGFRGANVQFVGAPTHRASFLGGAIAHLCPTEYVEPLGGSAIEAQLCGTPVIASSYGGFTETIFDGVTGFLCSSVDEMIEGVRRAESLDRRQISRLAISRYGIDAAAVKWRKALAQMRRIPPTP